MISTGMTGTARHGTSPNSASRMRVKTLQRRAPPRARIAARARAICGASIGSPAAFSAKYALTDALMSRAPPWNSGQPPSVALGCADVARDARLQLGLDAAEVVLQQDVLGRDRHVGLQLENPMSVGVLQGDQRLAGARDRLVESRSRGRGGAGQRSCRRL